MNARCEVRYIRVPDGLKTTPQTSDPSCSSGPAKRRNGETSRSGVIRPISRLPPSSQTKMSPAARDGDVVDGVERDVLRVARS